MRSAQKVDENPGKFGPASSDRKCAASGMTACSAPTAPGTASWKTFDTGRRLGPNRCTRSGTACPSGAAQPRRPGSPRWPGRPGDRHQQRKLPGAGLVGRVREWELFQAILEDADLTGANLRNVDLTGAILRKAILKDAVLAGANLTRVVGYGGQ
jgi:hypothetical protein